MARFVLYVPLKEHTIHDFARLLPSPCFLFPFHIPFFFPLRYPSIFHGLQLDFDKHGLKYMLLILILAHFPTQQVVCLQNRQLSFFRDGLSLALQVRR